MSCWCRTSMSGRCRTSAQQFTSCAKMQFVAPTVWVLWVLWMRDLGSVQRRDLHVCQEAHSVSCHVVELL